MLNFSGEQDQDIIDCSSVIDRIELQCYVPLPIVKGFVYVA